MCFVLYKRPCNILAVLQSPGKIVSVMPYVLWEEDKIIIGFIR